MVGRLIIAFRLQIQQNHLLLRNSSLSVIDGVPYDIIFDNVQTNTLIFNDICLGGNRIMVLPLAGCINDTFH